MSCTQIFIKTMYYQILQTDIMQKLQKNFILIMGNILKMKGAQQKGKSQDQKPPYNQDSGFFQKFKIQKSFIEYVGEDRVPTQLVGRYKGPAIQMKINILKCKQKFMSFGIMDQRYIKDRSSTQRPLTISYTSGGGVIQGNKRQKFCGTGYGEGDQMVMVANKNDGEIMWSVNGIKMAEYFSQQFVNSNADWVPVVQMFNKGDQLQWK